MTDLFEETLVEVPTEASLTLIVDCLQEIADGEEDEEVVLDTEELIEGGEAVDVVVDCDGVGVEVVALD